ncbi:hypothetical protein HYH03_007388 [Edaphochlamys debaryana]|uniref:SET domain-containing protein n=1 Tax=Edaphochlamys debaryana TaxID=47281 RepID=A0A835Y8G0_9CHLO|nr:hypothetical protein HYH03_007388 [Edaphochlamys debaryana]|eukprot:KAG2494330.1 hypothetical protein HYH03_007388 [Edaphochlamys debaryana]
MVHWYLAELRPRDAAVEKAFPHLFTKAPSARFCGLNLHACQPGGPAPCPDAQLSKGCRRWRLNGIHALLRGMRLPPGTTHVALWRDNASGQAYVAAPPPGAERGAVGETELETGGKVGDLRRSKELTRSDVMLHLHVPMIMTREGGVFQHVWQGLTDKRQLRLYLGPGEQAECIKLELLQKACDQSACLSGFRQGAQALDMTEGDWVAFRARSDGEPTHFNVEGWRKGPRGQWAQLQPRQRSSPEGQLQAAAGSGTGAAGSGAGAAGSGAGAAGPGAGPAGVGPGAAGSGTASDDLVSGSLQLPRSCGDVEDVPLSKRRRAVAQRGRDTNGSHGAGSRASATASAGGCGVQESPGPLAPKPEPVAVVAGAMSLTPAGTGRPSSPGLGRPEPRGRVPAVPLEAPGGLPQPTSRPPTRASDVGSGPDAAGAAGVASSQQQTSPQPLQGLLPQGAVPCGTGSWSRRQLRLRCACVNAAFPADALAAAAVGQPFPVTVRARAPGGGELCDAVEVHVAWTSGGWRLQGAGALSKHLGLAQGAGARLLVWRMPSPDGGLVISKAGSSEGVAEGAPAGPPNCLEAPEGVPAAALAAPGGSLQPVEGPITRAPDAITRQEAAGAAGVASSAPSAPPLRGLPRGAVTCGAGRWHRRQLILSAVCVNAAFPAEAIAAAARGELAPVAVRACAPGRGELCGAAELRLAKTSTVWHLRGAGPLAKHLGLAHDMATTKLLMWRMPSPDGGLVISRAGSSEGSGAGPDKPLGRGFTVPITVTAAMLRGGFLRVHSAFAADAGLEGAGALPRVRLRDAGSGGAAGVGAMSFVQATLSTTPAPGGKAVCKLLGLGGWMASRGVVVEGTVVRVAFRPPGDFTLAVGAQDPAPQPQPLGAQSPQLPRTASPSRAAPGLRLRPAGSAAPPSGSTAPGYNEDRKPGAASAAAEGAASQTFDRIPPAKRRRMGGAAAVSASTKHLSPPPKPTTAELLVAVPSLGTSRCSSPRERLPAASFAAPARTNVPTVAAAPPDPNAVAKPRTTLGGSVSRIASPTAPAPGGVRLGKSDIGTAAAPSPNPLPNLHSEAAGAGSGSGPTLLKPLACSVLVTAKMLAGGYLRLHPALADVGLAPPSSAAETAGPLPPTLPLTLREAGGTEGCGTAGGLMAATLSAARGKSGKAVWSLVGLCGWMAARGVTEGALVRVAFQPPGDFSVALEPASPPQPQPDFLLPTEPSMGSEAAVELPPEPQEAPTRTGRGQLRQRAIESVLASGYAAPPERQAAKPARAALAGAKSRLTAMRPAQPALDTARARKAALKLPSAAGQVCKAGQASAPSLPVIRIPVSLSTLGSYNSTTLSHAVIERLFNVAEPKHAAHAHTVPLSVQPEDGKGAALLEGVRLVVYHPKARAYALWRLLGLKRWLQACGALVGDVMPGELRLCGLTFHPDLTPSVRRAMREWEASSLGGNAVLARCDPSTRQISIPGVDSNAGGSEAAALAASTAVSRHGLRRPILATRLARHLGIYTHWDAPLPSGPLPLSPDLVAPGPDPERGGAGLFARAAIKPSWVLGVVGGYAMPRAVAETYAARGLRQSEQLQAAMTDRAGGNAEDADSSWGFLAGSFRLRLPGLGPSPCGADGCELSMLGYGNEAALVNDPRRNPRAWAPGNDVGDEEGAAAQANCMVLPVSIRGLVLPVLVALRDIAPGEQLLRDYGAEWWRDLADVWESPKQLPPALPADWELRGRQLRASDLSWGRLVFPAPVVGSSSLLDELLTALQSGASPAVHLETRDIPAAKAKGVRQLWAVEASLCSDGGLRLRGLGELFAALKAVPGDMLLLSPVAAVVAEGRKFGVELVRGW